MSRMIRTFGFVLLFIIGPMAFATHNLAGDITYRHVNGLTYEFTITIFSDANSPAIQRQEIEINWGDGTPVDSLILFQQTSVGGPGSNIVKRIWVAQHTFPGGGFTYRIRVTDPNRNANVVNMDNSVNVPFTIESDLTITPFGSIVNNSVQLRNDPLDNACIGERFIYNPGAFDPDGDSLAYRIASSKGAGGAIAPGYVFPTADISISVDPISGDLIWNRPVLSGLYNVAILILEYRAGFDAPIGKVLRDIQIEVINNCNNNPPTILANQLICIEAGKVLRDTVTATDPDGDAVTLTVSGNLIDPPIGNRTTFSSNPGSNPTFGTFTWNTICDDVRIQSYQLSIKAEDNAVARRGAQTNLTDFKTVNIRVIAPPPTNETATPSGKSIVLDWDNTNCQMASGYYIYRRLGFSGYVPNECAPGVPDGIGYEKIATINDVNTTTYTDDNGSDGLVPGQQYCYLITKFFSDGDESYPSTEVCSQIEKVVPVITHVSVLNTDVSNGSIELAWSPPTVFDTMAFPAPYRYLIYDLSNGPAQLIDSTNSINDTIVTLNLRNTVDAANRFRVDLYSLGNGRSLAGRSSNASSVFLAITPTDNLLQLSWQVNVPWQNTSYTIYRKLPNSASFDSIGTTSATFYNDSNLVNGQEYCYYIRSSGAYNLSSVVNPIINLSQEACSRPVDNIPPCQPDFVLSADCENGIDEGILEISWNNLNNSCADDIEKYRIYRSLSLNGPFELIEETNSAEDTLYQVTNDSIAGCYTISAVDSVGNESSLPSRQCVDFCPTYNLPNVFTPNGDGINDLFVPIKPFKYVDSIHIVIYNRWGEMVFESNDPAINWDGSHSNIRVDFANETLKNSNQLVSSGVYFYVCHVFEQSLMPQNEARILRGTITIIDPQPIKESD